MSKECTFEELPEKLQKRISGLGSSLGDRGEIEILRCVVGDHSAECFIKDGRLIGLYRQRWDDISCTWLNDYDIEFLHTALQSTRP